MGSPRRGSLAALGIGPKKPRLEVTLNDEQRGCMVATYTTLEKIEGTAIITCPTDLPFSDIHISFLGSQRTYVEKVASSAPINPRTQAFHNFMRLTFPVPESQLPADRIARAGVPIRIPFIFVVPERLLPSACSHKRENEAVRDAHTALPPSLGDPIYASDGRTLLDDSAPDNATISYSLRVHMTRDRVNERPMVLIDSCKKLRIIPAVDEAPPLSVSLEGDDHDYVMRRVKDVKKGLFQGKLGTLTMEADQPKAFVLPQPRSPAAGVAASSSPESTASGAAQALGRAVTTLAVVRLRFDPHTAQAKPPRLGSLSAKLKAQTFFSSRPITTLNSRIQPYAYDAQAGIYTDTIPLIERCMATVQWHRVDPSTPANPAPPPPAPHDLPRNISVDALADALPAAAAPNPHGAHLPHHTATMLVPLDLPVRARAFAPTFHACLLSRIYTLQLGLGYHPTSGPAAGVAPTPTLTLKLPVQVAAEGNPAARAVASAQERAHHARRAAERRTGREVERAVRPRRIEIRTPRVPEEDEAPDEGGKPGRARAPSTRSQWTTLRGARGSTYSFPRSECGSRSGSEGGGDDDDADGARTTRSGSVASTAAHTTPSLGEAPPDYDGVVRRGGGGTGMVLG